MQVDDAHPAAPVLSHRMKHDKSILALAVSDHYIFAGTQGGEILVCRLGHRCGIGLMEPGLQLGHVRAAQGHRGPQGQRARSVSVARQEAALLQRNGPHH